jgi:hypothetical protein
MSNNERRRVKFRLLGLLSKVYNIIAYIYKSPTRIAEWIGLVKRIILIDNCMR